MVERDPLGLRVGLVDSSGKVRGKDNEEPLPDLHRMSAAVVLCVLDRAYAIDGMCGASSWRSLGLHYIATTDFANSDELALPILARAVAEDRDNRLAQVALWQARYRHSKDESGSPAYWDRLNAYVDSRVREVAAGGDRVQALKQEQAGDRALLLRVLYSRVAIGINSFAAKGVFFPCTGDVPGSGLALNTAANELASINTFFCGEQQYPDVGQFARERQQSVKNLLLSVELPTFPGPKLEGTTPREFYQYACYQASLCAWGMPADGEGTQDLFGYRRRRSAPAQVHCGAPQWGP